MKAYTLDAFDAAPRLRDDLPEPVANEGELVVAVKATALSDVASNIVIGAMAPLDEDVPGDACGDTPCMALNRQSTPRSSRTPFPQSTNAILRHHASARTCTSPPGSPRFERKLR